MRMLLFVAAAMLALAGCQSTKLDADLQKSLPAICGAATQAHDLYVLALAADRVSEKTQRRADAAWASLHPVCADPDKQTTSSILTAAFAAYLTISAAAH
ncbi:cell wall anchor protein [Mesorhizobium sp. SP-1A]|uniref:cell wall anchor protein n=1 Tax=Mesorhizobium sp. SP-1A TaxID=3077840 RepID=UPI0028F74F28|nr:cell wall anchor protein [Mesorhizobium sp. SP-1A]